MTDIERHQDRALNDGAGVCRVEATLVFAPVMAALSLGAGADAARMSMLAVHRENRDRPDNDRIAIGLGWPEQVNRFQAKACRLRAFGSESVLADLLKQPQVESMLRRGLIERPTITEVEVGPGVAGTACMRSRMQSRYSFGELQRRQRRVVRRAEAAGREIPEVWKGPVVPDLARVKGRYVEPGIVIVVTDVHLAVSQLGGVADAREVMVSTYGLSRPGLPGFLPDYEADQIDESLLAHLGH